MPSKSAVVLDATLNEDKIETEFRKLDKHTKNMINRYNKSVDTIKKQEVALDKVKQKLDSMLKGDIVPASLKEMDNQLKKNNIELDKISQKYDEISSKSYTTVAEDEELKKLEQARTDLGQINSELLEEMKIARETAPEVINLRNQVENMTSSLEENKKQTKELGEEISDALKQKANFLGVKEGFEDIGKKVDKFKRRMTRLIGTVAIFSLLRRGLTHLRNSFISLLKQNQAFNASLNQIKANLMTAFAPIYNACLPAINSLMNALSKITGTIAVFVSGLFGKSIEQTKKEAQDLSKSLKDVGKSGEEATGSLASFDNLEVIGGDSSSGSGGASATGIDYSGELQYSQKLLDILNKVKKVVEKVFGFILDHKEEIIATFAGIFAVIEITKFITGLEKVKTALDVLGSTLSVLDIIGIGVVVAGLVLLIQDVIDMFKDPTWEKFGEILIDIGIILAGLLLIFGGWPLAIAAIIAVIVGVIIKYWDEISAFFIKIANWIYDNIIVPVGEFFKNLWSGIKEVWSVVASWFSDNVIKPLKDFFQGMWEGLKNGAKNAWQGIKNTFSTVATFFKDIFTNAWTNVKKVFSTGGKIFDGIKEGIVSAFKTVVNAIIGGINKVVAVPFNAINTALKKIRDIEFLGISPFKSIIKTISVPQIPKLATGTVIPPRNEFMAILGDQKRGVNIEAPLETIKEGVRDVLSEMGMSSNGKDIVIENLTIVNRMGTTDFSKSVVKGVRIAEKDLGKPLFVN